MLDGPHELQNLPIEGESRDSKRQAAEANAMAAGTSGNAEVIEKATVVDGKAWPGSKPAKRASEVDEAEEMPDECQPQSQQRQLYYKGSQCNNNTKRNIPSAHGVPLEGEWRVCASGRVRDSRDSASTSNAAIEHADSSSEQAELIGIDKEKLDGCEDGMGKRGCIDKWCWPVEMPRPIMRMLKGCCQLGRADSNVSCKEALVDGQGESGKLVPTTVELDDPGSSKTPRVYLRGMKTRIGKVESHGCQVDKSRAR